MHSFFDQMNFTGVAFLDALREFLQAFRLPGEAQKIDRFMMKFAERYYNGNPSTFQNAETPYVLAFATIMLNTDLHNPQIRTERMTKAQFIRQGRGVADAKELPDELLIDIYDQTLFRQIKLPGEGCAADNLYLIL